MPGRSAVSAARHVPRRSALGRDRAACPPNPALQLTASRARSFGFNVTLCRALAAAECQTVGRVSRRRPALSRSAVSCDSALGRRAAPKERIDRGMEARGAGCDSRQRFRNLKHTEARCAGCGSGSRGSTERSCSSLSKAGGACLGSAVYGAPAQPAVPADRFAREIVRFLRGGRQRACGS